MIDLHTHSRVSDGSDAPETIIDLAKAAGCTSVALTDHDRLDGIEIAKKRSLQLDIDFIPGVEISCSFKKGTFHLLVYFLEPIQGPLQDRLVDLQRARTHRNEILAKKLAEAGFPITWDELIEEAGGPNLGRPHFAALMVKNGVVSNIQEAFDKYLAKGKPFYVEKVQLDPKESIELALASGALPVLAHPLTLGLKPEELKSHISEFASYGLVGLESYYSRYQSVDRTFLGETANSMSLVPTGGSDYHGTYKSGISIGVGEGDLEVPDSILEALKNRLT